MKLLRGIENLPFSGGTVATIGNFDGVHRGHQALLMKLHQQADRMQLPATLLLFEPQPAEYFYGWQAPARLTSLREKLLILKQCNIDYVCCLKFNEKLASMPAEAFAEYYFFSLLKAKYLLVGNDFRFGWERKGDINLLKNLAKKRDTVIECFPDFSLTNERVSSTKIRQALAQGQLQRATTLLGRTFGFCGRVMKGDGRGRKWGIPTANLTMHRLTLPLQGVFCVQVRRGENQWLQGVANLGSRPTLDGSKNLLEIHLFDFDGNLYGELLQVFFLHKLRDEIKFLSVDALITQIHDDIATAKAQFSRQSFELIV